MVKAIWLFGDPSTQIQEVTFFLLRDLKSILLKFFVQIIKLLSLLNFSSKQAVVANYKTHSCKNQNY